MGKKIVFGLAVLLIVLLASPEAGAEKKVGILLFGNEVRYVEAAKGFMDALKEGGFKEPRVRVVTENAGANKAKAVELAKKFLPAGMDLIFTVGTHATTAVTQEIKDVPVVFSVVYDPVGAGIAKSWATSGNNTTGTSSKTSMTKLMNSLKPYGPIRNLAVLYTPGEKNSEEQLRDLQAVQASHGLKVIPTPLTRVEEFSQLLPLVMRRADSVYVTGSNLVNSEIGRVVDMANKAGVVTITHLEDLVEKGVLLGVCPSSYLMGRLAGQKAVQIFKGTKPSAIPIDTLSQFDVMVNLRTARAGGFRLPPEFMKTVKRTIK